MSKLFITVPIVTLLAAFAPLRAQNAPGDFVVERLLPLSAVIAPTPPTLPDAVLAGIQAGVIEIHQRFTYNSAQHTLDQLAFVVPTKSPLPFPDAGAAPLADHYLIQIESASISNSPRPSVILAGHVTSNDAPTPWGDITGAGVTLTFGYRSAGSSAQFGPILESVSPVYGLYSDTGAGSLSLTPSLSACTQANLSGTYMFLLGGSQQTASGWVPYLESGTFQADGKGNLVVQDSGNGGGNVFIGRTFPIAYSMNDNCTGTFSFGANSMDFQVSRDGKSMNMVFTKPSAVVANGSGRLQ